MARQSALRSERRVALALVVVLAVATLVAVPLYATGAKPEPWFVPLFIGSTGMADALAAALLFNFFRVEGRRLVLYGGTAYLLNALLIVPYGLTFPGLVDATGFVGNVQSAAFLWLVWHASFAALLLAGYRGSGETRPLSGTAVANFVGAAVAGACCVVIYATIGRDALPLLLRSGHFTAAFEATALGVSLLNLVAAVVVFRGERLSSLRLWLAVALFASALDTGLNGLAPVRFSLAWYVGKTEQFVAATVVLVSMLGAWSVAHARAKDLAESLALALAERRELQDGFDREHRASMAFQRAALPNSLPTIAGLSFSALYRAANLETLVGGDWYDAFSIDDGRVVLSVGDVMGSGLESAVTMNAVRQAIRGAAQLFPDPIAILDAVDRALRSERPQSIVTACVAVLDPVTRSITYASAGHPPPMWRLPSGDVVPLGRSGVPLGLRPMADEAPEIAQTMTVTEPSMLVFYTDGLTEATRDSLDGESRLRAVLAAKGAFEAADPADAIANAMLDEAADDVAIMTVVIGRKERLAESNGERELTWTFAAGDGSGAAEARHEMFERLVAIGMDEMEGITAELVFSELVANVARHCASHVTVDVILDVRGGVPVLHVLDRGPGFVFVSRLPSSMMSESGRGLFIVAQVARDFSVTLRPGGGSHARAVFALSDRRSRRALTASAGV